MSMFYKPSLAVVCQN